MQISLPVLMSITSAISVLCIVIFVLWYFKIRRYLNIRILREYGDAFKIIMEKKLPFNTETFSYKGKSYVCDTTVSIFDGNNNPELNYDERNAKPIHIIIPKKRMDSRLFETTLKADEYEKMLQTPRDKLNVMLFVVLVVCIAGLTVFTMYREIQHNDYVIQLIRNSTQTIPPVVGG